MISVPRSPWSTVITATRCNQLVAQGLDVYGRGYQVDHNGRGGNGQVAKDEVFKIASPARVVTHLQDEIH